MPLGAFKAGLMGASGVSTADVVLLATTTASDTATVDFTSGIDSTYGEYIFGFYTIKPNTNGVAFTWQANAAGGSGFNETITSTWFSAQHRENDATNSFGYSDSNDQAQATAYDQMAQYIGSSGDECCAGHLHLFNPSSTTYVKHFYSATNMVHASDISENVYTSGYINTTSAIDEVSFKMSSGNINGKIKMWGVK